MHSAATRCLGQAALRAYLCTLARHRRQRGESARHSSVTTAGFSKWRQAARISLLPDIASLKWCKVDVEGLRAYAFWSVHDNTEFIWSACDTAGTGCRLRWHDGSRPDRGTAPRPAETCQSQIGRRENLSGPGGRRLRCRLTRLGLHSHAKGVTSAGAPARSQAPYYSIWVGRVACPRVAALHPQPEAHAEGADPDDGNGRRPLNFGSNRPIRTKSKSS